MSFITVGAPHNVTLTATAPARHLCPYVNEKDEGTVTVTWLTQGRTFELHSLRRHLDQFMVEWGGEEISHEEFTLKLKDTFAPVHAGAGLQVLSVRTDWTTAGMPVVCST